MKRLVVLGILLALFAAACGPKGAQVVERVPQAKTPDVAVTATATATSGTLPPPSPATSPSEQAGTLTVQVWFTSGEHLFESVRTQGATLAVGRAALIALLAGPTAKERAAGVGTSIPNGTSLLDLNIQDGVATVNLGGSFDDGRGSLSERMRLAQVVYTITQFPTVQGVDFQLDGAPVTAFSGQGIVLDRPQTRADYEDVLPAIVVDSPRVGSTVTNPVSITGTANVFEATVSFQILDENGTMLTDGATTATCGTGCRGAYTISAEYHVDHTQPGTVVVFESSAKDGSMVNVVKIPVTLTA